VILCWLLCVLRSSPNHGSSLAVTSKVNRYNFLIWEENLLYWTTVMELSAEGANLKKQPCDEGHAG
jgi:hypothetical protein